MNADRLRRFFPLLVFALLASVFVVLQTRQSTGDYDPSALPSALVGQPVPEFNLVSLTGQAFDRGELPSKPFLLNVWATWCISCKAEHPYLNQLAEAGIVIVGLNYKDDGDAARRWLSRLGDPYVANIFDPEGRLGLELGVYGAPETFVVNGEGTILHRHVGVLNERVWRKKIQPLGVNW